MTFPETFAERIADDYAALTVSLPDFDVKNLEQPVPPAPVIITGLEDAVDRYRQEIDKVSVPCVARDGMPSCESS